MTKAARLTAINDNRTRRLFSVHGFPNADCLPRDSRTEKGYRNAILLSAEFENRSRSRPIPGPGPAGRVPEVRTPPGNCPRVRRRVQLERFDRFPREADASENTQSPALGFPS